MCHTHVEKFGSINDNGHINENILQNIDELASVLMDIQKETPEKGIEEILQDIALYSAQDDIMEGNYVSLMTVHTAKVLEFPVVFVVGLGEGVFPNQRAVFEKTDGLEEERRLCYVAVTRAKKECYLTSNTGYSFVLNGSTQVSRFINEMRNNIDYLNKSKRPSYLNDLNKNTTYSSQKINKPTALKKKSSNSNIRMISGLVSADCHLS